MSDGSKTGRSDTSEIELSGDTSCVPDARRFVTRAVSGNVADDAELVATELVTNAVLHGAPPILLRVRSLAEGFRVEVEDAGHAMPIRVASATEAMTGRGLALVDALSAGWHVERTGRGGKVVWADVGARSPGHDGAGAGTSAGTHVGGDPDDLDAILAAWSDDDFDEPAVPRFTVELGDVPTDLLLAAKAHVENIVRELTLETAAARGEQLPPELAALVDSVVHGFAEARLQIKEQAARASARGDAETHLTLSLPASAADAGEAYLAALDDADRYARDARLLSVETPPVHRVFRQWYVEALVSQLRALADGTPAPTVPTFTQRLAAEVTDLAPLREVTQRLQRLQQITAALAAARTVAEVANIVTTNAVSLLGAHAARVYELAGESLRMLATAGGDSDLSGAYSDVPIDADLPGGVALRTGEVVVSRTLAELDRQFPALAGLYADERSLLVAPLIVVGRRLGVLALTYRGESRIDDQTQLALLTTLADVTAQALDRASGSR